jgi:putative heme iron utilization protein
MSDKSIPVDTEAKENVARILNQSRSAALGVVLPDGAPMVTRVAFGRGPKGHPLSLVSDLSAHTQALQQNPACSLLIGEPGAKGDPMTHPRLTLIGNAQFVRKTDPGHDELAAQYLRDHPKSKLYIGFADFSFVLFHITRGHLNGGFGKAYRLTPRDMELPDTPIYPSEPKA